MKNLWKKMVSLTAAGIMLMSLAMPVMAETGALDATRSAVGTKDSTSPKLESLTFEKVIEADANTYLPAATYTFKVEGGAVAEGETYGPSSDLQKMDTVKTGKGTIIGDVVTTSVQTDGSEKGGKTGLNVNIDFSKFTFSQPGIYKYTVTEEQAVLLGTQNPVPDMKEDSPKTLYLYTRWDASGAKVEIYGAAMTNTSGNAGSESKTGKFTNEFKKNGGTDNGGGFL